ncbi:NfeD family protein [Yersinia aleksiciae]|uniref:Membrane protein n=1 Tax=Yersinia aleksiciae TaxID=263819 RepID=A0A0T9TKX7_YERAE|nr:NfeD family protein [Yersinia aleksiciae]AKP34624.1 membrane protein [Yersinia aleksiciae]MDA5499224.1 NfeD family protein [Yersinia aleksiciae]MDN0122554.1 NfeD family protein [Yersinia aleksiciae]NIL00652.1 NfeD family protein [Yersinia aleksiciae]WQC69757.1 NfeD family protein [Yersinia aleksiciae]
MLEAIAANPSWFWLSLGGLLLAAEMLGASGYMLWSGVAAVVVGALVWLFPFSWEMQGVLFAILTVVAAFLWWYWLSKRTKPQPAMLNQRNHQLLGTRATLTEPTIDGYGRMKVGDSSWRIYSANELSIGTEVEVILVEGNTLHVRAVHH